MQSQHGLVDWLRKADAALNGKLTLVVAILIFAIGIPALGRFLGYGTVAVLGVVVLVFGNAILKPEGHQ